MCQGEAWNGRSQNYCVLGGCLLSLSLCRRGFQDLLKVRPSSLLLLSAGRMARSVFFFKVLSASLSVLVKLFLGLEEQGNATVVLNTLDYKQITSLLEDSSYRRLARDPTDVTGAPTYQLFKYLAGLLSQLNGNLAHHVKNSFQFVQILKSLRVQPEDLMLSFDVVPLSTNVPVVY